MAKQKHTKTAEIFGWYGMIAILIAYGLGSFNIIDVDSLIYQILNISGSIGLIIIAVSKNVIQSVILNSIWALIGLIAIINIIF